MMERMEEVMACRIQNYSVCCGTVNVACLVHGSAITLETAHGSSRFLCAFLRRQPEMVSGL